MCLRTKSSQHTRLHKLPTSVILPCTKPLSMSPLSVPRWLPAVFATEVGGGITCDWRTANSSGRRHFFKSSGGVYPGLCVLLCNVILRAKFSNNLITHFVNSQTLWLCTKQSPHIINHHEHLSCFWQLYNRMSTAQVLAFPKPCDLG